MRTRGGMAILLGILGALLFAPGWNARECALAGEATPSSGVDAETVELYRYACSACHGLEGKGNGPVAVHLAIKPRNFSTGIFKFRSTPVGTMPTDDDLARTILDGIGHTAMPGWDHLDRGRTLALARYVKSFFRATLEERAREGVATGKLKERHVARFIESRMRPGEHLRIPVESSPSIESIERGRRLFETIGCAECHGPGGRGDGPRSTELKDDWGQPIRPADFTKPDGMKRGGSASDIYTTLMTGLGGTPMPALRGQLDDDEAWHIVHFIQWLQRK